MRRFTKYSGQSYQGYLRTDFAPPDLVLNHPEEIGRLAGAEHLLDCVGRQIYRVPLRVGNRVQSCFTYYFTNRSFTRAFRRCYALRTLRHAELLHEMGFPTLEVVAALKKKSEFLNWTSILVALEIQSVSEIPSRGDHVFQIHDFLGASADWPVALGRHIARFHNAGFIHGDLKTRHILANVSGGEFRFYLVDLEKCRFLPRCPAAIRAILVARDLIQLLASLREPKDGGSQVGDLILESYRMEVQYGPAFTRRVQKLVRLYRGETGFKQGKTVAENLWNIVKPGQRQGRP
jgi:hypothetical protein